LVNFLPMNVEYNYAEIVKILEKSVNGMAAKYYLKGMEREDIRQELWLIIFEKMREFNPDKSSIKTWANMIMKNRIIDLLRRNGYRKKICGIDIDGVVQEKRQGKVVIKENRDFFDIVPLEEIKKGVYASRDAKRWRQKTRDHEWALNDLNI